MATRLKVVDVSTLERWGGDSVPAGNHHGSPFPYNPKLNQKLILWRGDICDLNVGAIVCTTNERLTDFSGVARRIHSRAGRQLTHECRATEGCHTGDAIVTKGYHLPAPYVIHTVGPRFSVKYLTAAENALHSCYRRSLEQTVEIKKRSMAFCVINTESKGYPREQACHVAVRTIRRFLEKYIEKIDTVVLAMDNDIDLAIYNAVMPLYFPRDPNEEKKAVKKLPKDIGNALGGTTIKEREVRIRHSLPTSKPNSLSEVRYVASRIGPRTMGGGGPEVEVKDDGPLIDTRLATRQEDPDIARQRDEVKITEKERARLLEESTYKDYLLRAKRADLSDLEKYRFIYPNGKDQKGRPIIVFVASHLPAQNVDMDRVLLYIIKVMDPLVTDAYNLIYLHTNIAPANKPSYSWMRKCYYILNRKYKKNIKNLYLVHPTWWVKALFFFVRPFISSKFYRKIHYVYYLMDMYETFDPKNLKIPNHVIKYDQITNVAYYNERYASKRASRSARREEL